MKDRKYWLMLAALAIAWPLNTWTAGRTDAVVNLVCAFLAAGWLAGAAALYWRKGKEALMGIILSAGFVMGLIFVLHLPHDYSHDLTSYASNFDGPGKPDGHLGYIGYLVEYGRLPLQYDARLDGYSIFAHPPLHHIVHALWIKLNLTIGIGIDRALETAQLITLALSTGCVFVTVDLMREVGISEKGVRTGALWMAFQPSLLLFAGALNNDIQMVFLVLACLLFTVRWHKRRRMANILLCGLSLGCAMATKLNAAILIPCVAVVFATAFFRDLPHWKRYVGQFAAFLLVSVPQAVAWPLYHLFAFDMPLTYVRPPWELANVSMYSFAQRYGLPDAASLGSLFFTNDRALEHNVWLQTIKTGVFDELALFESGTAMWYGSYALAVLFAALLLCSLALFIRWLIKGRADGMIKLFLGGYGAILLGNYLVFTVQFPYICTYNFRYIMPVLALCAVAWGEWAQKRRFAPVLPGIFAALTTVVYGVYFF